MLKDACLVKGAQKSTTDFVSTLDPETVIQFQVASEFKRIQNAGKSKKIPVLFNVKTEDKKIDVPRLGLDLVILVDVSSSMLGQKIDYTISTLNFIISELNECDRLAIVKFNEKSKIVSGLVPMTEENKKSLRHCVITQITPCGATNIVEGLRDAFDILLARSQVNNITSICLLSDGSDTCGNGQHTFERLLAEFDEKMQKKEMDYKINSFGYGLDHDENILTLISSKKSGNFYYVSNIKQVDECFIDLVGFLLSVFATKGTIKVYLWDKNRLAKTYGNGWSYNE